MNSFRLTILLLAALITAAVAHAQEQRLPDRSDAAIRASRFSLVIDGVEIAQFSGATGLDAAARAKKTYAHIVLKRGVTRGQKLRQWHDSASSGAASARKNGSIVVYDATGRQVARYTFLRGWPSKWQGPVHETGGNAVAVESITITVERIDTV